MVVDSHIVQTLQTSREPLRGGGPQGIPAARASTQQDLCVVLWEVLVPIMVKEPMTLLWTRPWRATLILHWPDLESGKPENEAESATTD